MTDQEPTADAIKAALTAALPGDVTAYDLDEVPGTKGNDGDIPPNYVLVHVSRRYEPGRRASGEVDLPGGRATTRYVADFVDNAREWRRITTATLEDKILTLDGGGEVGPFVFEVENAITETELGCSGSDNWTF